MTDVAAQDLKEPLKVFDRISGTTCVVQLRRLTFGMTHAAGPMYPRIPGADERAMHSATACADDPQPCWVEREGFCITSKGRQSPHPAHDKSHRSRAPERSGLPQPAQSSHIARSTATGREEVVLCKNCSLGEEREEQAVNGEFGPEGLQPVLCEEGAGQLQVQELRETAMEDHP